MKEVKEMEQTKTRSVTPEAVEASKKEVAGKGKDPDYKLVSEMTSEEAKNLPVCDFEISRMPSKKNSSNVNFYITFNILPTLTLSKKITQAMFYIIQKKFGFHEGYNRYSSKLHYCLSRGKRKNAVDDDVTNPRSYYYYFEALLYKGRVWTDFLSDEQVVQMFCCELDKDLTFYQRHSTEVDLPVDEVEVIE